MDSMPPAPLEINREIAVWDPAAQRWERGRLTNFFLPRDPIIITWSAAPPGVDITPDHDIIIDVLYSQRITIQGDSTPAGNTSTDIDLNILTSVDGATWDTIPYVMRNWGDGQIKSVLIEVGPAMLRLRLDNNTPASIASFTARLLHVA